MASALTPVESLPGLVVALIYFVGAGGLWSLGNWSQYFVYFIAGYNVLGSVWALWGLAAIGQMGLVLKVLPFSAALLVVCIWACVVVRRQFKHAKQI